MDDDQGKPRRGEIKKKPKTCSHVSGREALKHCFCFLEGGFLSWPQTRSKSASAAFGLEPSDAFTHYWQRLRHRSTALNDSVRTKRVGCWGCSERRRKNQSPSAPSEVAFTDPGPSTRRRAPAVISAQSQLWITLTRSSQPPRLRFEPGNTKSHLGF